MRFHTSGSTGKPKEIDLSPDDIRLSALSTISFFNLNSDSILACALSTKYIAGYMMVERARLSGARLLMDPPSNRPFENYDWNGIEQIDLMAMVPSQIHWFLQNKELMDITRNLIIGGAPLSQILEIRLLKTGVSCYATYGMTETASHVALRKLGENLYKALDDISFAVDDYGRLIINSSKRSFKSLQTNDVVELVDDRSFIWKGRADNVINSGGIKIHPEEIEGVMKEYIGCEIAVIPIPDEKWGTVAVVVLEEDFKVKEDSEILGFLKEHCGDYAPKKIVRVKKFPTTPTGKLARKELIEIFAKSVD